ncbi:urocanate hydratase, partial [Priestia sp. AB]|nr:urocanate hydratase [Priestia sp. AB]
MMYGQMTAGSWIYIGSQGIVQGTYETFAECAKQHFNGSLAGTITVTAGLGGMGGAQPLAVTMAGGVVIGIDVDRTRIEKRIETRYCDIVVESLDEAIKIAKEAKKGKKALSIGLVGNAAEVLPQMIKRGFIPDIVTDQTSAHDPLNGYLPVGFTLEKGEVLRTENPEEYVRKSKASMAVHVQAMLDMQKEG